MKTALCLRVVSAVCILVAATRVWGAEPAPPAVRIDSYTAFIGPADMRDDDGKALQEPWQILRQDRVNYHVNGIRQDGDELDYAFLLFSDWDRMEELVKARPMAATTAKAICDGGTLFRIEVWGRGRTAAFVTVRPE